MAAAPVRALSIGALISSGLVGGYLGSRAGTTYAAPTTGSQQGDPWLSTANSGLCAIVDDTTVYDDTSLRTAIAQSNDGDVICLGHSIQLSGPLDIDDTTITLIGDDSSTTLTAASNSAILRVDFNNSSADDTLTLKDLTLTGAEYTTGVGGALYVRGSGDTVIIEGANFTNNIARSGGAAGLRNVTSVISYSIFDNNSGYGRRGSGGAIYFNGDTSSRFEISHSRFTNNDFSTPSYPSGDGTGGSNPSEWQSQRSVHY